MKPPYTQKPDRSWRMSWRIIEIKVKLRFLINFWNDNNVGQIANLSYSKG
jgi:hypothetical protein